jgi:hypothetical protein
MRNMAWPIRMPSSLVSTAAEYVALASSLPPRDEKPFENFFVSISSVTKSLPVNTFVYSLKW